LTLDISIPREIVMARWASPCPPRVGTLLIVGSAITATLAADRSDADVGAALGGRRCETPPEADTSGRHPVIEE
jgi:hypothetical protein